jgi:hypothetical protein
MVAVFLRRLLSERVGLSLQGHQGLVLVVMVFEFDFLFKVQ